MSFTPIHDFVGYSNNIIGGVFYCIYTCTADEVLLLQLLTQHNRGDEAVWGAYVMVALDYRESEWKVCEVSFFLYNRIIYTSFLLYELYGCYFGYHLLESGWGVLTHPLRTYMYS
jgi:hypothetical protein